MPGGGILLLIAFSLSLHAFLFPSASSYAETVRGAEVGASVKEFIKLAVDTTTLALSDGTTTVITPSPSGTLITGDVNLAVTTNSIKGYVLSVYTADGSTGMSHSNSNVGTEIESIAGVSGYNANTGLSSLSADTWGFRKYQSSSSTYSNWYGVGENSSNGTLIASTDSDDADFCGNLSYPLASTGCTSDTYDTYLVNFGAKVSTNLPAGTYTNNVTFSAIAKSEGSAYTLNFGANGGQNVMGPRTILSGSTITLPTEGFVKEGRAIKGWALVDNATPSTPPSTSPIYLAGSNVQVNDLVEAAIAAGQSVSSTSELTLYAVWDIPYTIAYNGNGSTSGSTTSQSTFLTTTNTIKANGYEKTDYNFLGWALTSSATEPNTNIDPNDTISTTSLISLASAANQNVSTSQSGTITLYAVWEQAGPPDDGNKGSMQSFSCTSVGSGHTATVTDSRDSRDYKIYRIPTNQTYEGIGSSTVANIAGKCIMTQDLMLGYNSASNLSLSTSTSAGSGTINYVSAANNGTGWDTTNDDTNLQYTYGPRSGYEAYSSHSYYSYGAAQKVCPKGWRLPTSDEYADNSSSTAPTKGLAAIVGNSADGSTALQLPPWSFVLGGVFLSSGWSSQGVDGIYWSSTQRNSTSGYYLHFTSSRVYRDNNIKYFGRSVRCIAG